MPKPLNSSALLQRHQECKQQNKERLKEVRNLEDLINFKVKTVADTMEAATRKAAMNQLTSDQDQVSVSALKQICDPLLAGRHYPQLLQKRGVHP